MLLSLKRKACVAYIKQYVYVSTKQELDNFYAYINLVECNKL